MKTQWDGKKDNKISEGEPRAPASVFLVPGFCLKLALRMSLPNAGCTVAVQEPRKAAMFPMIQSYLLYLPRRLEASERLLAVRYIIESRGNLRSKAEAGHRKGSTNIFCEGPDSNFRWSLTPSLIQPLNSAL